MTTLFGDSFAAYQGGWPTQVGVTANYATRGSSEYRIYRNYMDIQPDDRVIFVHTHWSRIYLQNKQTFGSRLLKSHRWADVLIGDLLRNDNEVLQACNMVWDEEFLRDNYDLYLEKLMDVPGSYHFTFFSDVVREGVYDLSDYWERYPGRRTINHLNRVGNERVAEHIKEIIG